MVDGMSQEYQTYLDGINSRLQKEKFQISYSKNLTKSIADLFAYKVFMTFRLNYRATVFVKSFAQGVQPNELQDYFDEAYQYGTEYENPGGLFAYLSFPVSVARSFSAESKTFVSGFSGKHNSFPNMSIEHPVLAELESSTIYHFEKTQLWGNIPASVAVKDATKYFSF